MKLIYIFLLFIVNFLSSQTTLVIKDSITKLPIELAAVKFINNDNGTFSNSKGEVICPNQVKQIEISLIGYENKLFDIQDDTNVIYLKPKHEELDEITIYKKIEIRHKKRKSHHFVTFKSNSGGFIYAYNMENEEPLLMKEIYFDLKNDNIAKKAILKVYSSDINGLPHNDITKQHIAKQIIPKSEGLLFDLGESPLEIPKNSFIALIIISQKENNTIIDFGIVLDKAKKNNSFFKAYFKEGNKWQSFPDIKKNKVYNFNANGVFLKN